jgi:hypothetical protein
MIPQVTSIPQVNSIPHVIVQTSREKPEQYIIDKFNTVLPGWEHKHFNDIEIIQFFIRNPIPELPNPVEKFYSFSYGAHRADFFRYYYLYVMGGVYVDMDAMIYENISDIIENIDFFSVNSTYFPGVVFQGFIGCVPRNDVVFSALKDVYFTDNRELVETFHLLCKNLYGFVNAQSGSRIKMFEEVYGNETDAHVVDKDSGKLILIHYHINKIIPRA